MENKAKNTLQWFKRHVITTAVAILSFMPPVIKGLVGEQNMQNFIVHYFSYYFPLSFFIPTGVEIFLYYRKAKKRRLKCPLKPRVTYVSGIPEAASISGVFAMDLLSILVFNVILLTTGFGIDTIALQKIGIFHTYYAVALVPFISTIIDYTARKSTN